jgi:hypothetical protein
MRRLMMLLGVVALASCGGNRADEAEPGTAMDTTGGGTLKVPGDSVRLEDTLSAPPPTDSAR